MLKPKWTNRLRGHGGFPTALRVEAMKRNRKNRKNVNNLAASGTSLLVLNLPGVLALTFDHKSPFPSLSYLISQPTVIGGDCSNRPYMMILETNLY